MNARQASRRVLERQRTGASRLPSHVGQGHGARWYSRREGGTVGAAAGRLGCAHSPGTGHCPVTQGVWAVVAGPSWISFPRVWLWGFKEQRAKLKTGRPDS